MSKYNNNNNIQFEGSFSINENIKISVTVYKESRKMSESYSIMAECHLLDNDNNRLLYKSPEDTLIEGLYYENPITKNQIEKEIVPFFKNNIDLIKYPHENTKKKEG